MCDFPEHASLTEQDIAEITARTRSLPGDWSVFPHVNFSGEVTLLLNPAEWEDEDRAILLQRDPEGIKVMLSVGDSVALQGVVPDAAGAVEVVWRASGLGAASRGVASLGAARRSWVA